MHRQLWACFKGVIYRYEPLIETIVELPAGADVTHSRSFDTSEPSVAAVVGSINPSCTRYAAQIKLQGHRVEMVQVRRSLAMSMSFIPAVVLVSELSDFILGVGIVFSRSGAGFRAL